MADNSNQNVNIIERKDKPFPLREFITSLLCLCILGGILIFLITGRNPISGIYFSLLGLSGLVFFGFEIRRLRIMGSWPKAEGTVLTKNVHRIAGILFSVDLRYSFMVNGLEYQSNKYYSSGQFKSFFRKKIRSFIVSFAQDDPIEIQYNPADPWECHIKTENLFLTLGLAVLCLGLTVLGIGIALNIFHPFCILK